MKEYFSNRNEKLLKKLFEHQKITVKEIGIPQMTAWQAHEPNESKRRRIEEDFKVALQENWLATGKEALTNEELQTALESIISEKIDIENDKIAGKTIPAHVEDVLPLVDDPKTGNKIANPSKEEEIENIIKQTLTNTNDKIQALGTFYQLLSKKENEANGDAVADSPEDAKAEIKAQVKAALEGDPTGETGAKAAVVPLEKAEDETSLKNMLSTPKLGLDKKIQIKILRAMAGQLKGNNIQFAESDTIEEEGNKKGNNSNRARAKKKSEDYKWTQDVMKFKAFVDKNPQVQSLLDKIDNKMDVTQFMLAVIEMVKVKNSPEDIIRALTAVLPIVKKDIQQDTGEEATAGELNLQTSRNEIDYSGILDYLKASKVDDAVTNNVSRVIQAWYKKHLADKDVKLTEDSERFFSSMLESFKTINRDLQTLKTEVHVLVGDNEKNNNLGESKDNPYAICTASVGREDEKKYKSCKDKVAAKNKK